MSKTFIFFHSCHSPFQDKLYGAGMRVFNLCKAPSAATARYRCTVCGREK